MKESKILERIESILCDVDDGDLSDRVAMIKIMKIMNKWRNDIITKEIYGKNE